MIPSWKEEIKRRGFLERKIERSRGEGTLLVGVQMHHPKFKK